MFRQPDDYHLPLFIDQAIQVLLPNTEAREHLVHAPLSAERLPPQADFSDQLLTNLSLDKGL